ncbi:MAG TPA: hypothetical protein VMI33_24025 [Streptosporangiaceae bacterium]|nr:hypothetical protein [Streptosporangiaceae bacterium]
MAPTSTLTTRSLAPLASSLAPLASFAHDWVGGDIHGLAAFAGTLYGYVPRIEDVVTALDKKVDQIVGDAGWAGAAATAFATNWEKVSAETNAIGLVIVQTGSIVDQLAVDLSKIENALEQAAAKAEAHGVGVGADGQPPQACYANPAQESWRLGYDSFYQQCMAAAENARVQAAGALHGVYGAMTSGKSGQGDISPSGAGTKVGEGSTLSDYLADLLATPTAYANQVADKVAELTTKAGKAYKAWQAAQAAARRADGRFGVMPDDVKADLKNARTELASAESDLARAQDGETAFTKFFGTRLRDLPGLKGADAVDALRDGSLLDRALDVPVVDVVAGGIATVLNAQQDERHGVPGWLAYPLETGGTVASIAAGTAVAGVVGGAVAGASIVGAPVLGVVAGVAVGGAVAYGVGDYIHNYIEDFGAQWHQHGVLGIVTDFGAAGVGTWDDTKQLVGDAGHAASSVWHGITSLF